LEIGDPKQKNAASLSISPTPVMGLRTSTNLKTEHSVDVPSSQIFPNSQISQSCCILLCLDVVSLALSWGDQTFE
jgi:hypothetical protein